MKEKVNFCQVRLSCESGIKGHEICHFPPLHFSGQVRNCASSMKYGLCDFAVNNLLHLIPAAEG